MKIIQFNTKNAWKMSDYYFMLCMDTQLFYSKCGDTQVKAMTFSLVIKMFMYCNHLGEGRVVYHVFEYGKTKV